MVQTGENIDALRRILDMTRLIAISLLALHYYYYCHTAFEGWGLTASLGDRLLLNVAGTGLFSSFHVSKLAALAMLAISLLGTKGKKDEKLGYRAAFAYILSGLLVYFCSPLALYAKAPPQVLATIYMVVCSTGFLFVLTGGTLLTRVLKNRLSNDVFNKDQETFPQEERLLENDCSINLPARYRLKGKWRNSQINLINPYRGILLLGTPGAGKSYFVIRHIITQHIRKGFTMFVYDFKFDDLSRIAYNAYLRYRHLYKVPPKFYVINFDDLTRTNRCNPLDPLGMNDITDAGESARTILLGLNREWIKKQGDFFVESSINFLTAIIWYMRKYREGMYCTLPHVIEMMQLGYDELFTLLRAEPEIETLVNPFVNAYLNDVMEQLEGQIGSAKIAIARLSSPQLYYVLSGNDFKLDINNPDDPKILCAGNNPQKIQIYGAVLSLYSNRLIKLVNQKGKLPCSLVHDEFATEYITGIDSLIATARSNRVATTLAMQDMSQLRKDYGKEQADVIVNIIGNIISGQVTGDTAKLLSERFGKIMQERESISISSQDTNISRSKQLEAAIPQSTIATLSSGEFVGAVADDPDNKIELKTFHCQIINDHDAIRREEEAYRDIPVIRNVTADMVNANYARIRSDVNHIVDSEIERLLADPSKRHLVIRK